MKLIPTSRFEKLQISYGVSDTACGECFLSWTKDGICFLGFGNALEDMKSLWIKSEFSENSSHAKELIDSIFIHNHKQGLIISGTEFQIKVWNALCKIPSGTTVSYETLAKEVGGTNYTRPCASAIARNNISYLIPCHRVIRKSGDINKFRWGADVKRKLLEAESYPI